MQVTRERSWAKGCGRLIFISLFTWPIPLGGMGASGATDSALQLSPLLHDFGAVKRLSGQVHTSFMVHNQGETPIKIRRIWTSWPCTTATLVVAERKSPTFDMFNNHPQWSETLKPGEQASLLVSFDPNYHGPEGVGLQEKAIRITASDIHHPLAEIRLKATVIDDPGRERVPGSPNAGAHGRKGHQ